MLPLERMISPFPSTVEYCSFVGLNDSRMARAGMTYLSSPTLTSIPSIMARVKGSLMINFDPWPGLEFISTLPLSFSMAFFTTSIPTPRPDMSVISLAVENPG